MTNAEMACAREMQLRKGARREFIGEIGRFAAFMFAGYCVSLLVIALSLV